MRRISLPSRKPSEKASSGTWWAVLFVGVASLCIVAWSTISDTNDLYWHVRMGMDILNNHRLTGDPSWTFGPVFNPDWVSTQGLSEILMYGLWKVGGWTAFVYLHELFGIIAVAVLSLVTYKATPSSMSKYSRFNSTAVLVVAATMLFLLYLPQERPQTISLILLMPTGLYLYRFLLTGRVPNPFLVFFIVMVWGWFHGLALLVGPLLLAAWGVRIIVGWLFGGVPSLPGASVQRTLTAILGAFIGTIANPIGLEMYGSALRIKDAAGDFISEWRPFGVLDPVALFVVILYALWIVATLYSRSRRFTSLRTMVLEGSWLLVVLAIGAGTARTTLLTAVLAVPLVARRFTLMWPSQDRPLPFISWKKDKPAIVVLFVLLVSISIGVIVNPSPVPANAPQNIFLGLQSTEREKRIIVDWNIAGQVQQFSGEESVTSIDGRADRYGRTGIKDYGILLSAGPSWLDKMKEYPGATDAVLNSGSGLAERLASLGWNEACRGGSTADGKTYVWLTSPSTPKALCGSGSLRTTGLG